MIVVFIELEWILEVVLDVIFKGDGEIEILRVGYSGKGVLLLFRVYDWLVVYFGLVCDFFVDLNLMGKVVLVEEYFCFVLKKEDEIFVKGGEFVLFFNFKVLDNEGLFNGDWRWFVLVFIGDE